MASSNIKLFDENKGNMLSDSEFSISNQRMNGLQTGVASSQLQNKAMYQASLVAYAIAQIMMQNGKNANDTDAVSAFVANLSGTMLQKVYDIATTAEAKAGVATGKWMSPALVKLAIDTLAAKASNILSDTTKALYGLGTDAVPDDVLAFLGKYAQYWWKRRSKQTLPTPSTSTTKVYLSNSYSSGSRVIYYSDSAIVNEDGSISLVNEQSTTVRSSESTGFPNCIVLKGKYIRNAYSPSSTDIYFIPEDATFTQETSPNKAVTVLGYNVSAETVISEWEFVRSSDRNAYPDSGESGWYEYQYLGIPFDNAVTAPKIATGNYFGTGTYGSSNPSSLSFGFKPRVVFIFYSNYVKATNPFYNQGNAMGTFVFNPYGVSNDSYTQYGYYSTNVGSNTQNCYAKFDDTTNTLYWYNTSGDTYQGNIGGGSHKYHYVAIG